MKFMTSLLVAILWRDWFSAVYHLLGKEGYRGAGTGGTHLFFGGWICRFGLSGWILLSWIDGAVGSSDREVRAAIIWINFRCIHLLMMLCRGRNHF